MVCFADTDMVLKLAACSTHDDAFRLPFQPGMAQSEAESVLRQRIDLLRTQTRNLLAP